MNQKYDTKDKKMFWELLIIGLILIVGGLFSLICPMRTFTLILKAMGLVALTTSLAFVVRFFRMRATYGWRSSFSLTLAVFSLAVGLLFLIKPEETTNVLIYIVGIWFIAYAVFALFASFPLRILSRGLFWLVLAIGCLMLLSGILLLVMPEALGISLGVMIGVSLLLNGLEFVLLALGDRVAVRKRAKAMGPKVDA